MRTRGPFSELERLADADVDDEEVVDEEVVEVEEEMGVVFGADVADGDVVELLALVVVMLLMLSVCM